MRTVRSTNALYDREVLRVKLREEQWTNRFNAPERHGIKIKGAYYQPKAQRLIIHGYSVWASKRATFPIGDFYEHYNGVTIHMLESARNLVDIQDAVMRNNE